MSKVHFEGTWVADLQQGYYPSHEVERLVKAVNPVLYEFSEWIKQEGGCDHSVGICYCRVIHLCDELKAALEQFNQTKKENVK